MINRSIARLAHKRQSKITVAVSLPFFAKVEASYDAEFKSRYAA
ncbi:hypothetical protein CES85_3606 (plasmid) [Ochrobactrum quorumnocens]|uniref:Uncharacterized protein n=1 Tax=Ochrobactrum quorumnocens TaxID=271865 RepID=A0A248UMZ7_9HYPH|nr:hypothetical protein CES85_3606 [[Ochrobactrum] quorumnocens]